MEATKKYMEARAKALVAPIVKEALALLGKDFFELVALRGDDEMGRILTALHPEGKVKVSYSSSGPSILVFLRKQPEPEGDKYKTGADRIRIGLDPTSPERVKVELALYRANNTYPTLGRWTKGAAPEELPQALLETADELIGDAVNWAKGFLEWARALKASWGANPAYRKLKGLSEIQELG